LQIPGSNILKSAEGAGELDKPVYLQVDDIFSIIFPQHDFIPSIILPLSSSVIALMFMHGHIAAIFSKHDFMPCPSLSEVLLKNSCIIDPNIFSILDLLFFFLSI
jgi:hypothetical protein